MHADFLQNIFKNGLCKSGRARSGHRFSSLRLGLLGARTPSASHALQKQWSTASPKQLNDRRELELKLSRSQTELAGPLSQTVWKNFFEGFFEEYDEEYDEEYALDFRPQRAQEACNGDAAFCAFWLLEASDSQSSFQRSQQMTELLSS